MEQSQAINKTFLIILLGILAAIGPFTIDMYLPGFKQIAQDFGTDEKQVAFTLTSYFVGIAFGQLIYGPLVDKYGRKKPLLAGLSIYVIAALGCALSTSIESLIFMRLVQALGGCVGMVASNAIISDVYPIEKRAKAFSMIMLVMGVAPVIAPSVGSLFLKNGTWNNIFFFLAAFALLVFLCIYFFLPETSNYMHKNKLKINEIAANYLSIFKNKTFLFYTIAGSLAMAILFAYISSASFVFQTYYGLDNATFSKIFAINASGLVLGNILNGYLSGKINYLKIARVASILIGIVSVSAVALFAFIPNLPYQIAVVCLFSILVIVSLINPNASAASLSPFTKNSGAASALGGSFRMAFGATIAAVIGVLNSQTVLTMFVVMAIVAVLVMVMLLLAPKISK